MEETLKKRKLLDDINLEYSESNLSSVELDILLRYWTRENGDFSESVNSIAKSHGLTSYELSKILKQASAVVTFSSGKLDCVNCGVSPSIATRSDFQRYKSVSNRHLDRDGFCAQCQKWHKPLNPNGSWIFGNLTRTQLQNLVSSYYAQVDCADLIKNFKIEVDSKDLELNLQSTMSYENCRHCNSSNSFGALNQLEYKSGYALREVECDACGHRTQIKVERWGEPRDKNYGLKYSAIENKELTGVAECSCKKCVMERNRDPVLRRKKIIAEYCPPKSTVKFQDLSLKQVVCLIGMLWSRTAKDNSTVIFQSNAERMSFTPGDRNKWSWIKILDRNSIIYVDAEISPLNAFGDEDVSTYSMSSVVYKLNIELDTNSDLEPTNLLSLLINKFRNGFWLDRWEDELLPLWKDIAFEECMAYVENRARHFNLDVPNEEKLREIIIDLLDDYSVSEVWYMISVSYWNAAAFSKTDQCRSSAHATNIIPSKILSMKKLPRSNIRSWDRINEIQRGAISEVLFEIILGAEHDVGFTLPPGQFSSFLLNRYLERNNKTSENPSSEMCSLGSDAYLRELADEFGDRRIDELVEYVIATRKKLI